MAVIDELGLSQEQLREMVIDRAVDQLLSENGCDENGREYSTASTLQRKVNEAITKRIDAAVNAIGDKHVLPQVTAMLENQCLQETNKWGEKTGQKLTFTEYLVKRAEAYVTEMVDFSGKSKSEADSYSWSGKQSRITYLVNSHLQYTIENAVKQIIGDANKSLAQGLNDTIKAKLAEVVSSVKVGVSVGK